MSVDLFTAGSARFSPCRRWRYALWRRWGEGALANFLLLNPSTADESDNDPTVERCQRRAAMLGYDGLVVTNLFAWRSTDPSALYTTDAPVGPDNDAAILEAASDAALVVCGWGNHGQLSGRGGAVLAMLRQAGVRPHCLAMTGAGEPQHPLYLPYSLVPQPMDGAACVSTGAD